MQALASLLGDGVSILSRSNGARARGACNIKVCIAGFQSSLAPTEREHPKSYHPAMKAFVSILSRSNGARARPVSVESPVEVEFQSSLAPTEREHMRDKVVRIGLVLFQSSLAPTEREHRYSPPAKYVLLGFNPLSLQRSESTVKACPPQTLYTVSILSRSNGARALELNHGNKIDA